MTTATPTKPDAGTIFTTPTNDLPAEDKDISPPDGKAHYARKRELAQPGSVVVALCGRKWIPQHRGEAATSKPVCKTCKELYNLLPDV